MQKQNIHLHNCSQTDLKRPQKCSHGTNLFIKVKVQFLCIDFANHRSCTSKKVQIDPKTSLAGRSTGFGPNYMWPNFLGSFWWQLTLVSLHLKSKIIGSPYNGQGVGGSVYLVSQAWCYLGNHYSCISNWLCWPLDASKMKLRKENWKCRGRAINR